jgi:predicted transposase YbfD/YdcC
MLSKYTILPKGLSYSAVFSVKPEPVTTLWYTLHTVVDYRRGQGKRHDLPTLLTLAILALCSGHTSYLSMQEWCVNYQDRLKQQVPFLAGHMPNAATFHRVFANLDTVSFEDVVGKWIRAITPLEKGEGIGLDGKSLHGANLHLVAAFAHVAKAVLFEMGTDIKGKELVVGPDVLTHITIKDHVVTGDALFAQRSLCEQIEKAKGGYVFRVKGNQDTLEKNIRLFFKDPPFKTSFQTHTTVDRWKGQVEQRIITVSSDPELLTYLSWPGLTHAWKMRKIVTKKNAEGIKETITTVSVGIARIPDEILVTGKIAEQIAGLIRGHWGIENRLHRTRDVTFNEDNCTIRKGHAPQTMAILKNIVTSLFHRGTVRSFPAAMRRFAAKPEELFSFLGLPEAQKAYIA